jgi:hypothetical protein
VDEKDRLSAPGGVPGAAAWVCVGFQERNGPVVLAAKSFVFPR